VSQVTPIGGGEKQYQVILAPSKLRAYSVSLKQVTQALTASNTNVSAGFMIASSSEYLVTGLGRMRTPEDIGAAVVAAADGVPIRVSDLGTVRIDAVPKRNEGSINAQPGMVLGIEKQPGANTLTLTRTLEAVLDELQEKFPEGMWIQRVFRQADVSKSPSRTSFMPCATAASWSSRSCSSFSPTSGRPSSR
jgi:Cu/Ag efflux pump CusA